MSKLRVLLADDHPVVRDGLRNLIDAQPDMEVIAEAFDGEAAVRNTLELRPDVVVMDLSMPNLSGVEATTQIHRQLPDLRIVVLTAHEDHGYLQRLLSAGAIGYVLKRAASDELVRAIRCATSGETYIDPAIAGQMVAELGRPSSTKGTGAELSEREGEVLQLIAKGHLIKQIAARLKISGKSVETYKARAMEKLGLKTRVDVVRYAAQQGWMANE